MNSELEKLLKNFDALLISSPANIIYLTGFSDFSETERECFILITKNSNYLITDRRYSQAAKEQIKDFTIIESGVGVFLKNEAVNLFKKIKIKTLGFEANNLTVSEYSAWKKIAKLKIADLSNLRTIKSEEEIKNIKLACRITDETFDFIIKKIKLGVSEKEIARQIELFINNKNAETSFKSIVAYGKNSAIPHHQSGNNKLRNNQIVLLDFGVKINNYCSDMSRTVFFGSATTEFKRMHKTVFEAQQKAIQYINSQLSMVNGKLLAKDIDKVARDYIVKQRFPNIIHSVGHGTGIEVHEAPHISPNSNETIKDGMVFSIEPGIYLPDFGGVRIEDLYLFSSSNLIQLTKAPKYLIEIS